MMKVPRVMVQKTDEMRTKEIREINKVWRSRDVIEKFSIWIYFFYFCLTAGLCPLSDKILGTT